MGTSSLGCTIGWNRRASQILTHGEGATALKEEILGQAASFRRVKSQAPTLPTTLPSGASGDSGGHVSRILNEALSLALHPIVHRGTSFPSQPGWDRQLREPEPERLGAGQGAPWGAGGYFVGGDLSWGPWRGIPEGQCCRGGIPGALGRSPRGHSQGSPGTL